MYLSADIVKKLKSTFGNQSICGMVIISYPELAYSWGVVIQKDSECRTLKLKF